MPFELYWLWRQYPWVFGEAICDAKMLTTETVTYITFMTSWFLQLSAFVYTIVTEKRVQVNLCDGLYLYGRVFEYYMGGSPIGRVRLRMWPLPASDDLASAPLLP